MTTLRVPAPLGALLLALLVLAAAPGAAQARTGACLSGSERALCSVWTGKVTFVDDGDTIEVDVDGDGSSRSRRVRITGLQAMELTRYSKYPSRRRGACHGVEATARLEGLIRRSRWRVRLAAVSASSHSGVRPRRSVAVRIGGRWQDVGRIMIAEGHALWLSNPVESAWNREYSALAEQAAAAGRGIYDTDACGRGPAKDVPLSVSVNWDADGNDFENPNGEWIRVENDHPTAAVSLAGWWVRDSDLRRFRFPSWARVEAGESVLVRVGSGTSSGSVFHWGLRAPAFENVDPSRGIGDGAYLFDPQGDLRAWSIYH